MNEPDDRLRSWARRMQSIAQAGLTYARDPYDQDRYRQLRDLAAEVIAEATGAPLDQVAPLIEAERGYLTPKVDVRAVVFHEGKVLLVRERADGLWSLPGGWADAGVSPTENVVREVREETGYVVRAEKLLAVFDKDRHAHPRSLWSTYKIFVRCALLGGAAATSLETSEVGFFGRDDLPPLSTGRVTEGQIRRMFAHHDDPGLPTDVD
ncbi:MAG: NUDIX hydrolase [Minicystis sp.]